MPLHELRPNATFSAGGWTPNGGPNLVVVTSDDNTGTYAETTGGGVMRLEVDDIPPLGDARVVNFRVRAITSKSLTGLIFCRIAAVPTTSQPQLIQLDFEETVGTGTMRQSGWVQPQTVITAGQINSLRFQARILSNPGATDFRVHEAYIDIDVRDPVEITDLEVLDASDTDQCGSTITDTVTPRIEADSVQGYSGAPADTVFTHREFRIFTDAQVIEPGFDPWVEGPWGPPVWETDDAFPHDSQGNPEAFDAFTDPLQNGDYHVFARYGTTNFLNVTGEIWWGNTATCEWTQNFPVPDAPTLPQAPVVTECPPQVEIEVEHTANTTPPGWDDPDLVRVQVQKADTTTASMLTVWRNVPDPVNGSILPEDESIVITDRFVQVSAPDTDPCAEAGERIGAIVRGQWYRARLYGYVNGAPANTAWVEPAVASVIDRCADERCPTWLIHPQHENLNWSGVTVDAPWTDTRPHNATQPAEGGRPTVVVGRPTGRDHQVRLYEHRTPVNPVTVASLTPSPTNQLQETLASPLLWFVPNDGNLPAVWVAPGPTNNYTPLKINTGAGFAHAIDALLTEVDGPVMELPDADVPEPVSS